MEKRFWNLVITSFMLFLLASCGEPVLEDEHEPDHEDPPDSEWIIEPIDAAIVGQCYVDEYPALSDVEGPSELDILIVSYGAINLKPERDRLADNLDVLIAQFPPEVDYRIGVIQGFGTHHIRSGKLYRRNNEPLVLRSDSLSVAQIQQHVRSKLNPHALEVVMESIFGAGSMGMVSLYQALTTNKAEIQGQGLLRDEASLLVLFVSDQADVCAVYPQGVQTRNKLSRASSITARAIAYERDCFPDGELLSAQRLVETISEATAGEHSVAGVFYNNPLTVPHAAWKEFGFGYNDVIAAANGISHDLASSNYAEAMAKIGSYASANVVQGELFNLRANNILPQTIEALLDGDRVRHTFYPETNQVSLFDGRGDHQAITLKYCERKLADQRENLQVEPGGNHTCALHANGTVRCWGQNNFGQLGQGHTQNLGDASPVADIPALEFSEPVIQLAAGGFHTCALLQSGSVQCWGRNDVGQLGLGDSIHRGINETAPEVPFISLGAPAAAIYAGTSHTCALMENGSVRCWGRNLYGELGLGVSGSVGTTNVPTDVPALVFTKEVSALDISTVSAHTCAIFTDNTMSCWGRNDTGQLGYGDTVNRGLTIKASDLPYVSVDSTQGPIFVATGNLHTCVMLDGLDAKCWGSNQAGALGRIDTTSIGATDLPSDWSVINLGYSISGIANSNATTCALSADLGVKCWGDNRNGQAGVKSPDYVARDTDVSTLDFIDFGGLQFDSIVGGTAHFCGLTRGDGKILCWGDNRQGQLGFGDTLSSNSSLLGGPATRGLLDFGFDEDGDSAEQD
jgi:alpha-tubulin suppressor-like RCC1 family protein